MQSEAAKNINFSSQGPIPMARAVAEFLIDAANLGQSGDLLEAGAGKGEFLSEFLVRRPGWKTVAFEPSDAAVRLAARLPNTEVYRRDFQTASIDRKFDVVASLAVIEHVEQPFEFLCWLRDRLTNTGALLVTFPDFARNPNDIFCVDHLSKLTLPHLKLLMDRAGLEIEAVHHVGIALLAVCRHASNLAPRGPRSVLVEASKIYSENQSLAAGMLAAVRSAREAAKGSGQNLAIFGLGMAGLIGPTLIGFDRSEISAYIDENETMQSTTIGGVPVVGLQEIERLQFKHIAVSASPLYREQISRKLGAFDATGYF